MAVTMVFMSTLGNAVEKLEVMSLNERSRVSEEVDMAAKYASLSSIFVAKIFASRLADQTFFTKTLFVLPTAYLFSKTNRRRVDPHAHRVRMGVEAVDRIAGGIRAQKAIYLVATSMPSLRSLHLVPAYSAVLGEAMRLHPMQTAMLCATIGTLSEVTKIIAPDVKQDYQKNLQTI